MKAAERQHNTAATPTTADPRALPTAHCPPPVGVHLRLPELSRDRQAASSAAAVRSGQWAAGGRAESAPSAYSVPPTAYSSSNCKSQIANRKCPAFTLIEMLVVMAIMVLAITMAIPAIKYLTGSGSQQAATNTLSSFISFAHNDAIGLQQTRGVMFFLDDDDRVKCAEVMATPPDPALASTEITSGTVVPVYLDLVPDRDVLPLPQNIRAWTLKDQPSATSGVTDPYPNYRYLGFNDFTGGTFKTPNFQKPQDGRPMIGGVILFGPDGRLISKRYGFRFVQNGNLTGLGALVAQTGVTPVWPTQTSNLGLWSQIGCVLLDKEAFQNNEQADGGTATPEGNDPAIETKAMPKLGNDEWLDANTTPLFVNRYSGTLMMAE